MAEITITMNHGRSMKIPGPVIYIDEEGNERLIEKDHVSLCRCGGSQDKPFCDNTHRTNGFDGPAATFKIIINP